MANTPLATRSRVALQLASPMAAILVLGSLVIATSLAQPAVAHHSAAAFNQAQTVVLTGTVRDFQWANPHCYIQLLVRNASGVEEEWSLEMGAPMHLYARGWRPKTVKAGDKISVAIHPLRDGRLGGEVQAATTLDGKPLGKDA